MKRCFAILLTLCMLFTQQNVVMLAAELGEELVQEAPEKMAANTGKLGDNNGFTWTYDATNKTLTVTGADTGLIKGYNSPFLAIGYEVSAIEKIVLKDCTFKVSLYGLFWDLTSLKDVKFVNCDATAVSEMTNMFRGCTSLVSVDFGGLDTSNVQYMDSMFMDCSSLPSLNLSGLNTSKATGMAAMFQGCTSLVSLNLDGWDTSNVAAMTNMFYDCEKLTNLDVSGFNTSNVVYMGAMFNNCPSLTTLNVSKFDTSKVQEMNWMFKDCSGLTSLDVTGFNTSKVYDMRAMFQGCSKLTTIDVSKFDTSNVLYMSSMFSGCSGLTSINVSGFKTSKATTMGSMFYQCSNLTSINVSAFDTSNVTDMDWMFGECTKLTTLNLSKFNMGNVTSTYGMLVLCSNLKTLYTPKALNSDTSITLPNTFKDTKGNSVRTVTSEHCNMVLTKAETQFYIPVPEKPNKIVNTVSGVHVYWEGITGVTKYGVWRSETGKDGTYKWIANPEATHFTDTKVESGKTYYYKVTACIEVGLSEKTQYHSDKSEAIGIVYTSTPDITSRVNKAAGVELKWNKITGATGYGIYRKSYDGDDAWVRIATIDSGDTLSYTDTSVKNNNGTVYKYTIRALAGKDNKTLSGCRSTGRTMVRLSSQILKSAAKTGATSIKCSWSTSSQVIGYELRFMVGNKVEKTFTVGNFKTGTKTFTDLKAGQTYKVQVRTYKKVDGVGTFYSAWSTAKSVTLP